MYEVFAFFRNNVNLNKTGRFNINSGELKNDPIFVPCTLCDRWRMTNTNKVIIDI